MSAIHLDRAFRVKGPLYTKTAAFDRLKDYTLVTSFASYISQWGQKLSSGESISKKLGKANSSIKSFSSSFALAKLVRSLNMISSGASDLFTLLAKRGSKKEQTVKVAKKAFLLGSSVASGVSDAVKTVLAIEKLSASAVRLPETVSNGLGEMTSGLGIVTNSCFVVKHSWNLVDLHKSAGKGSAAKRLEIARIISRTQFSLIEKVMSLAAAILGVVALIVSIPVLPWVMLSLSVAAFGISFALQIKKHFDSAPKLHYLKA